MSRMRSKYLVSITVLLLIALLLVLSSLSAIAQPLGSLAVSFIDERVCSAV